jgi:peptide chain release factor 3
MAMERARGISITSAALQFSHRDVVINLLDTPGHADFSEDTYRVLTAVDCAVMLLDAAKGLEPQTLKLFEVCRHRRIPVITFVNKWDRPGLEPLALLDEIEARTGLRPTPSTWPVGIAGGFHGVVDRRTGAMVRFERTPGGATAAIEEQLSPDQAAGRFGEDWSRAVEELDLLAATGAEHDQEAFLTAATTPVLFGAAVANFGVRLLLDALVDLAPPPAPRPDVDGRMRDLDAPFSGFVFKIQANMDPAHRDQVAFVRVCSGRFERGSVVTHAGTGRPFATKYAQQLFGRDRETVDVAYPGDVVGW